MVASALLELYTALRHARALHTVLPPSLRAAPNTIHRTQHAEQGEGKRTGRGHRLRVVARKRDGEGIGR